MDTIQFTNVVPRIFMHSDRLNSDVWCSDIRFDKGKLYLVEAGSGKGKSTFCSYILGYRHDYDGTIAFDGRDIKNYKPADWTRLRQANISHLFQELRLFPELTAIENVEIKNRLTGFKQHSDILAWFERLGIADKVNSKVAHMSFGQQQRVAMMRALAQPFDFLLADEPISHLDDENSETMSKIMMEEASLQGAGVIVTSIGKHMNLAYSRKFML